jgi:hypothetical protein
VITRAQSVNFSIRCAEVLYNIVDGILRRELRDGGNRIKIVRAWLKSFSKIYLKKMILFL